MDKPQDIAGILMTCFINEKEGLFIILQNDGAINRMGIASLDEAAGILCIGQTSPSLFESLETMISPDFFQWFDGKRIEQAPKGHMCQLTVVLAQNDGTNLVSEWEYGSDS